MAAPAPDVSTRSIVYRALRFLVVMLLVGYVLHRARLTTAQGWTDLLETFRGSHVGFLVASLVFTPLVHFQSTVKWYALTRATGLSVPLRQLYYFFVVGRFYNLILPSNIGGDLIRIRMLGVASGRYADAAATVFVERLTGGITLAVSAVVAILIAAADLRVAWLFYAVAVVIAVLGGVCWAVLDERPVRLFMTLLEGYAPLVDAVVAKLVMVRRSIVVFRDKPSALAIAFGHYVRREPPGGLVRRAADAIQDGARGSGRWSGACAVERAFSDRRGRAGGGPHETVITRGISVAPFPRSP